MVYLQPSEYALYGLDETTSDDLVSGASLLVNAFCKRSGLDVQQYIERWRSRYSIRLSYLPTVAVAPATSCLVSVRGHIARRDPMLVEDVLAQSVQAFGMIGSWVDLDIAQMSVSATGELSLGSSLFGEHFDEVEVTYTAGWEVIPSAVKTACAQIVKNAQATPALNVQRSTVAGMTMQYFAPTLMDKTVEMLLAPYVARRVG